MQMIQNAKMDDIKFHHIVYAVTSKIDYEMYRIVFLEYYPDYGNYTFAHGSHCSCYDFDSTTWELTVLENLNELRLMLAGWYKRGDELEGKIAKLIVEGYCWENLKEFGGKF